jgi:hypothetical protein
VLLRVRHALHRHVIGPGFGRLRRATVELDRQLDGHRAAAGDRLERRAEAVRRQHRGMKPLCELAQLLECRSELGSCGRHTAGERLVARQAPLDQPEREQQRDEALLRPVMEVALEALALRVGRLDDPRSRFSEQLLLPAPGGDVRPAQQVEVVVVTERPSRPLDDPALA